MSTWTPRSRLIEPVVAEAWAKGWGTALSLRTRLIHERRASSIEFSVHDTLELRELLEAAGIPLPTFAG
jgi:hypothetical protein